jgi:hypothetical protein
MFLQITTRLSRCKMLAHVLWLFANPTLHCKAIKGPGPIRNRSLTEEHDVAVLCINHPNEKICRFCKTMKEWKHAYKAQEKKIF